MQNKANFKMGNINISTAIQKIYANEQRTMSNERYPKQTQSNPIPPPATRFFVQKRPIAQSLSQAKLRPQLSRNFASRLFNSLHCGRGLVFATAASAQPDASLQGIWFDTIMPSKYHCSGIDLHR
jgi:hypothetical protein